MSIKIVERILGKLVGHEISVEELEKVSGGTVVCPRELMVTQYSTGEIYCDKAEE